MDRMILPLLGAIFLLILGAAGPIAWDRHPPLGLHTKVLFWTVGFDLPDSLATRVEKAIAAGATDRRGLAQCRANTSTLRAAVTVQNEAVEALGRESRARVAASQKATQAARPVASGLRARAGEILSAKPAGPDLCVAADRMILQEAGR
ncbi:MAG: hypothetical protein JWQ97_1007 [Phenylobacterium sp.]|nr:hypothetical protein [Phenylobacterium sp.]